MLCPNKKRGCEAILKRGDVQSHIDNACGYVKQVCQGADCTHWIRRKDVDTSCSKMTTRVWCSYCNKSFKGLAALREHRDDRIFVCPGAPDCKRRCLIKEALAGHEKDCEWIKRTCKASSIGCNFTALRSKLEAHQLACQLILFMPQWQAMQERFQQHDESFRAVQERCQHQEQSLVAVQARVQQQEETLTTVQEQKTQLEQEIQVYRTQLEHEIDGVQRDVGCLGLFVDNMLSESSRSTQEQLRQEQRDGGILTEVELRLLGGAPEPIVIDSDEDGDEEDGDEEQHNDDETRQEPQSERTEGNSSRKRKRTADPEARTETEIGPGVEAASTARTRSSFNLRPRRSAASSQSASE